MRLRATAAEQAISAQIAAEIRAELARQGLSQQALAEKLGWPYARLGRRLGTWASPVPLTISELVLVADVLGVEATKFLPPRAAMAAA